MAKGTITQWSCDLNPSDAAYNGFMTANNETDYVLGPGGEQVTEMAQDANGTMNWQRSYVYAGGALIATYDPVPNPAYPANPTTQPPTLALPSFRLTDCLGTLRATTDSYGVAQGTCTGFPYGDGVTCSGDIPDNHHFTGKERDPETGGLNGNDYFGARYYASTMGRWLSPDWSAKEEPVPYVKMDNPQTLNLYAYVGNNPLIGIDVDGHQHGCTGPEQGAGKCSGGDVIQDTDPNQKKNQPPAQQQNSTSKGTGFWRGLGQRFKNWFNDDGFKTNEELDREAGAGTFGGILNYSEADLSKSGLSTVNDQAALFGALIGNTPIGYVSTAVSVYKDPSFVNMDLTGLSITVPLAIPGADVPIAFGFAGYSGSQFAGQTMQTVFTPDALQSDTINVNGITVQDPQAKFDSGNW